MTIVRESFDLVPLCPHCQSPLDEVLARTVPTTGSLPQGTKHLPTEGILGRLNSQQPATRVLIAALTGQEGKQTPPR